MRRALTCIATLLAGAAAVLVIGLLLFQLYHDSPPPNDSDMRPKAAAAAGEDNAYEDFVRMTAKLQLSPAERELLSKQERSKTPDLAACEPLIARNSEVLALFTDFSHRSRFSDPNYLDPAKVSMATPVPQFFPIVSAARMSSLRAAALLRRGRAPEALEEALGIMNAGQTMMRSDQPLITALVGILLGNMGASRAREVIESGTLDKARLLSAARQLSAYRGGAAALQSGFRFEYLGVSNMIDHLPETASDLPNGRLFALAAHSRYMYQPEQTRALFAERFRPVVEGAAKPCLNAGPPANKLQPLGVKPNLLGRILFNIAVPQYEKLFTKRCEYDFRAAALAVSAALSAYRLDHRRFPATLAELVPRYLAAVPADPFTGAALLYSPETGKIGTAGKGIDGEAL